ncbi:MAG: hypothetical protein EXR07_18365 [Acetobacteraceae bacterium]|nr:hypothetical protein [Acetobacteraceae bacterium]
MLRAYSGILALLCLAWLVSENRRQIRWRTVLGGLALQLVAALVLMSMAVRIRV